MAEVVVYSPRTRGRVIGFPEVARSHFEDVMAWGRRDAAKRAREQAAQKRRERQQQERQRQRATTKPMRANPLQVASSAAGIISALYTGMHDPAQVSEGLYSNWQRSEVYGGQLRRSYELDEGTRQSGYDDISATDWDED
jgi:hypothetical protein